MSYKPLVSIITPSYNQGEFLEETILSVLNQNYSNIEYIIIDGGSTDNSIEIIKKYEKRISYWISEPDNGQADAINKGFFKAKGDLLCWVNSDDILYPHFVTTRVIQFEQNKEISMIYGDVEQGWEFENKVLRKGARQSWKDMITSCVVKVPQMSAIWTKEIFSNIGGLDVSFNVLLDWEYFVRIAHSYKIQYYPGAVAFFRQHKNSKSINLYSTWATELIRFYENYRLIPNKEPSLNYNIIFQDLYFYCASLVEANNEKVKRDEYYEMARSLSVHRFYWKYLLSYLLRILLRTKRMFKNR